MERGTGAVLGVCFLLVATAGCGGRQAKRVEPAAVATAVPAVTETPVLIQQEWQSTPTPEFRRPAVATPSPVPTERTTPIPTVPAVREPTLSIRPILLHYGDVVEFNVSAPGAASLVLTANIEDPPWIALPYDARTGECRLTWEVPRKGTVIDEGDYVITVIVKYPDGTKKKVRQTVTFKEKR